MKKIIPVLGCSLALLNVVVVNALAVWVPSTSLDMSSQKPVVHFLEGEMRNPRKIGSIIDTLEEDERRLSDILTDLRQDQAELENLTGLSKPDLKLLLPSEVK